MFPESDERLLYWLPQPDITAHELALALNILLCPMTDRPPLELYDELPPEIQRHFSVVQPEEPQANS